MRAKRTTIATMLLALAGGLLSAAATASTASAAGPLDAPIYVANATEQSVDVYDSTGHPVAAYGLGYKAGDGFAVEHLNQDGFPEILVAHADTGFLDVYDHLGQSVAHFDVDFDPKDLLAVGNVLGDGSPEILVTDQRDFANWVDFYSSSGSDLGGFQTAPFGAESLAAGDVNGNGTDEIWVSSAAGLDIFDATGLRVTGSHSFPFEEDEDKYVATDIDGNGTDEMVLVRANGIVGITGFKVLPGHPDSGFSMGAFPVSYFPGNAFGAGDLENGGSGTVFVGSAVAPEIIMYDIKGVKQGALPIKVGKDDVFTIAPFADGDLDSDGIPDSVELTGIRNADGTMSMNLAALGASPCRKDLLVEIDYMSGSASHSHQPLVKAKTEAETAFSKAPLPGVPNCPYPGKPKHDGVHLIIDDTGTIPEKPVFKVPADFNATKSDPANFDVARDPYVHYSLWVHNYEDSGGLTTSSGMADFTADHQDFLVSLGSFNGQVGSIRQQSGTFMHELGHSLGLGHGGGDDLNYKPNYLSIMNYSFTTAGFKDGSFKDLGIDYSRTALPRLDAKQLSETAGIGSASAIRTAWLDGKGLQRAGRGDRPSDWSGDDADGNGIDDDDGDGNPVDDVPLTAAIAGQCVNGDGDGLDTDKQGDDVPAGGRITSGKNLICETKAAEGDSQEGPRGVEQRFLEGFDDWTNLNLRRATGPGINPPREMTAEEAYSIQQSWDAAAHPDRKILLDAVRPGFRQVVLGVAIDKQNIYATHYYETVAAPHTSDRPGSLVVVDRTTLQVKARIPVGTNPRSLALNPVTGRLYVLNANELRVVDRNSHAVETIQLGGGHVDVAVNSRLNRVYISNQQGHRIDVVDGATNAPLPSIPIGPGAVGLTVDETTNKLYVALNNRSVKPFVTALGSVTDHGSTQQVHSPVPLGVEGTQPNDVAVDPVKHRIYVANLGGGTVSPSVSVVDSVTRQVIKRINVPLGPARAITVNPDAHQVFVAGEARVHVIDDASLSVVRTIPAALPFSVATDIGSGREIFVGDIRSGEVSRYSYSSGNPS